MQCSKWKGINRKQSTRWQHLSRLKASAFFSLQKIFSCYKTQQLILGTGIAIWWLTEPHYLPPFWATCTVLLCGMQMLENYAGYHCCMTQLMLHTMHFITLIWNDQDCCRYNTPLQSLAQVRILELLLNCLHFALPAYWIYIRLKIHF
jgi:hypothetical protein